MPCRYVDISFASSSKTCLKEKMMINDQFKYIILYTLKATESIVCMRTISSM